MARKATTENEEKEQETNEAVKIEDKKDEIDNLNRMLAAVLHYISDEDVEEIDLEYLLNNTEGLRDWWNQYRESNKKEIAEEIKKSLSKLSLEELEKIREQINEGKK